jgi:RND family efflux transporter MFP subunit
MLRSFNSLIVMLFMLAAGIGLVTLIVAGRSPRHNKIIDFPPASAAPTSSPAIKPAPDAVARSAEAQPPGARYLGVIFARQSADIVARSEGRLEAVYASLGDHLKPGAVIARIESSSIAQQLEMAQATLRSAQAEERNAQVELKDAESRYARREALVESGVLSKEDLATARVQVEKAETNQDVARAHIAEQMARVEQSRESLANTVIRTTFEGTVAARYLDAGAAVRSGAPIISLMRTDDLWVRFAIPDSNRAAVAIGSAINFYLEELNIEIPAAIEHLSPGVAAISQELIVEAKLKIPAALKGQIKSGGSGLVSLAARSPSNHSQTQSSSYLR